MNIGQSATGSTQRREPLATKLGARTEKINTTFSCALARLLTINDAYGGNRVLKEAIMDEINCLSRFTKNLLREVKDASADNGE